MIQTKEQAAYSKAWGEGYAVGLKEGKKALQDQLIDLLGLFERFEGREEQD